MSRPVSRRLPWGRRLGAILALLALAVASLAVMPPRAVAASAAIQPVIAMPADAGQMHDHGHDPGHAAAHRHDPAAAENPSGSASGTGGDTDCLSCKDCAFCSPATGALPAALPLGDGFARYSPAGIPALSGIDPPRLTEPPRL